jgi:Tol biopolymer transport system component
LAPAAFAAILVVALTPAGATVGRVISNAIAPPPARPMLSLPTGGKLLVSGAGGTWIVAPDGTRSRVGSWRQGSWSPHARYVVVASRDRIAAVTQGGEVKWELSRRAVSDPSWFAPSGFRVAYRSGSSLRVVAGDGTGDRLLATGVASVTPAWRPGHAYQLAYVRDGRVVLRGADSRRVFWTRPAGSAIKLQWSADGSRLLLLTRDAARVLSSSGQTQTTIRLGGADRLISGSISPNGRTIALVRRQGVQIARLSAASDARAARLANALPGTGIRQVSWSPDSRWLLISWPTANEWVFLATGDKPRLRATSRIAERFGQPGTSRPPHRAQSSVLPQLDGWCCTASAAARPPRH